jgi:hypothetical protein
MRCLCCLWICLPPVGRPSSSSPDHTAADCQNAEFYRGRLSRIALRQHADRQSAGARRSGGAPRLLGITSTARSGPVPGLWGGLLYLLLTRGGRRAPERGVHDEPAAAVTMLVVLSVPRNSASFIKFSPWDRAIFPCLPRPFPRTRRISLSTANRSKS